MTNREAFNKLVEKHETTLAPITSNRAAAKKKWVQLIKYQADKAEGLLPPDHSRDSRRQRAEEERAAYKIWSEQDLSSIAAELDERKLFVHETKLLLPSVVVEIAEAEARVKAEQAKLDAAKDLKGKMDYRIGVIEQRKIGELEDEREGALNAADMIATGENPQFWKGRRSPHEPPREEPVVFNHHDFAYDPNDWRVTMSKLQKAAAEMTKRYAEKQQREWKARYEANRLSISLSDVALLEEDPQEAA